MLLATSYTLVQKIIYLDVAKPASRHMSSPAAVRSTGHVPGTVAVGSTILQRMSQRCDMRQSASVRAPRNVPHWRFARKAVYVWSEYDKKVRDGLGPGQMAKRTCEEIT